ncbi:MAG: hypothetical protein OEU26_34675, partial [Candidatus Tectomicrobia bacterium]|nr:hypothetical protein [Candidatus Tectomicrobia bacterium]
MMLLIIIVNGLNGTPSYGIVGVLFLAVIIWVFVAMMSVLSKSFQICPKCYHRDRPGYTVCAGCGYTLEKEVSCDSSSS